jgi:outer membrane protein OmpA-like peptidoglycan-associated protein
LRIAIIAFHFLLISIISAGQISDHKNGVGSSQEIKEGNHYLTRVNRTSAVSNYSDDDRLQIDYLIKESISIYIDQSYRLTTKHIQFRKSEKDMIEQMNGLVNQSLTLFQIDQYFSGFSYHVVKTMVELKSLNWGTNEYLLLGDDQAERDFVLANYINHEVKALENLCHAEVDNFLHENNIDIPVIEFSNKLEELAMVTVVKRNSEDYLTPIEFTLDWPIASAFYELDYEFPKSFIDGYTAYIKTSKKTDKKHSKRKKDYTQELINVIKQNSEQLSALQKDLKNYNEAGIVRDNEQNNALQMQIAELQNQINDINKKVDHPEKSIHNNENKNAIVTLDKATIHFGKNSISISASGKVLLNLVFESLLKMEKYKVIITGYTDKSGSTDQNVYLSQKRAQAVKNYLVDQGINKDRLIVTYMGDLYSNSENSSDRKVTVEFINKVSSIDFTSN